MADRIILPDNFKDHLRVEIHKLVQVILKERDVRATNDRNLQEILEAPRKAWHEVIDNLHINIPIILGTLGYHLTQGQKLALIVKLHQLAEKSDHAAMTIEGHESIFSELVEFIEERLSFNPRLPIGYIGYSNLALYRIPGFFSEEDSNQYLQLSSILSPELDRIFTDKDTIESFEIGQLAFARTLINVEMLDLCNLICEWLWTGGVELRPEVKRDLMVQLTRLGESISALEWNQQKATAFINAVFAFLLRAES